MNPIAFSSEAVHLTIIEHEEHDNRDLRSTLCNGATHRWTKAILNVLAPVAKKPHKHGNIDALKTELRKVDGPITVDIIHDIKSNLAGSGVPGSRNRTRSDSVAACIQDQQSAPVEDDEPPYQAQTIVSNAKRVITFADSLRPRTRARTEGPASEALGSDENDPGDDYRTGDEIIKDSFIEMVRRQIAGKGIRREERPEEVSNQIARLNQDLAAFSRNNLTAAEKSLASLTERRNFLKRFLEAIQTFQVGEPPVALPLCLATTTEELAANKAGLVEPNRVLLAAQAA
ncbi:hypothetical protein HG530_014580 [Fusarium avenaceum]|nr:hypothetical protein HG530_014580 [Fusarium avenaceum]